MSEDSFMFGISIVFCIVLGFGLGRCDVGLHNGTVVGPVHAVDGSAR